MTEELLTQWVQARILNADPAAPQLKSLPVQTMWAITMASVLPAPGIDEALGLSRTQALLFHGPEGVGKRTLAQAMAQTAASCRIPTAVCQGLDFDGCDEEEIGQRLVSLIAPVLEEDEGSALLVLDTPADCDRAKVLMAVLANMLHSFRQQDLPLTLVVIQEDPRQLSAALRRLLIHCRFQLPDMRERSDFFTSHLGPLQMKEGIVAKDLAKETEGLSFRQMEQVVFLMKIARKSRAMDKFHGHISPAKSALAAGDFALDLETFRTLVGRVRTPEKAAPIHFAPNIHVQAVGAAASAPAAAAVSAPKAEESFADRLEQGSYSDFAAMLRNRKKS